MNIGVVYFNHGKESGPWGIKIQRLAQVARVKGFEVASPDYSGIMDPEIRVRMLLASPASKAENLILVGSSMGGYVAAVASDALRPEGLFLMAPALNIPGYVFQMPAPYARVTTIVHAWEDEIIPVEDSIHFAQQYKADLHLVHGDHRLISQLPFIAHIFSFFLDNMLEPTD
jgi:surfactin synthase thioesterase subunit